jgi:predicted  nucleic acid-binding Zn-ribbon protein
MVLIPIAGSGLVTWAINRRKDGASVALADVQTDAARKKIQADMQHQIDDLFDELTEARGRIRELEDGADVVRKRVKHLEDEVGTLTRYLRRVINQMHKLGIVPDLPPEVIEQLFKGTV